MILVDGVNDTCHGNFTGQIYGTWICCFRGRQEFRLLQESQFFTIKVLLALTFLEELLQHVLTSFECVRLFFKLLQFIYSIPFGFVSAITTIVSVIVHTLSENVPVL